MRVIFAFVGVTIIGLIMALLVYLGAFKSVSLSLSEAGPIRLVSKHHVGPYHKIVPTIEEVEDWAAKNGETCQTSFGEYLDDPDTTDEDRLKSNVGCLVTGDWSKSLPHGFDYREIPRRQYVIAEFEGAPSIGPFKVYPKAKEFIASSGLLTSGSVIELYERQKFQGLRTKYHFPVSKY